MKCHSQQRLYKIILELEDIKAEELRKLSEQNSEAGISFIEKQNAKKLKAQQDLEEQEKERAAEAVKLQKQILEERKLLLDELEQYELQKANFLNAEKIRIEQEFREAWNEEFNSEEEDIEEDPKLLRALEIADYERQITLDNKRLTNEGLEQLYNEDLISYAEYVKGKQNLDELQRQSDIDNLNTLEYTLGRASSLFKEDSAERKAFATANIIISTARAIMGFTEGYSTLPVVGQALAIAASIATAATGAAQIAKVNSVQFARGGVLDGPSHAQGGITTPYGELEGGEGIVNKISMSNPSLRNMASAANVAGGGNDFSSGDGSIKLSPESIAMITNGINDKQVYVSETDITSTQNKVKVIEDNSKI